MAIELYHWEPNGACGQVLIALKEKGLDFKSHYVDVLAFEQHKPEILKLSPTGQVPILIDNGEPMTESSYIIEYLEEAYPQNALMPKAPLDRWKVRVWQKYVDDYVGATVSSLAWAKLEQQSFKNRDRATLDKQFAKIPMKESRDHWVKAVDGEGDEVLERSREREKEAIGKIEEALKSNEWLAGPTYTLADISLFPYVNFLPSVAPELANKNVSPKTLDWLGRMKARPAVKAAMAMAKRPDPFATVAPGPEHVRWG
jgi:GSH-dependent disulfide-bond oxidoreductase